MFRFRLQQVLDLREQAERRLAGQLADALGAERAAQATLDGLRAARHANAVGAAQGVRSVGELTNLAFMLEQLDGHIACAGDAVTAAGSAVIQVQDALASALRDRRVLDRLRDRQAALHRTAEVQSDQRTMDDIALSRYVQQDGQ